MSTSYIPLVDLHRHLEGSVRLETVIDLARQHGLSLPAWDLPGLQKAVWVTGPFCDILDILPRFQLFTQGLVDYEACRRITWECLDDAAQEGLDYVEIRFSPLFMAEPHHLDPYSVTSVVCETWQEASQQLPIDARLVVILSRTYGPEACEVELQCALKNMGCGIAGLDLAGDEARYPAELFEDHFRRAREEGLFLTAHAGEFAGAESVRQTVLRLGVDRIGHGVHAVDDPTVLDLLQEHQVAIECCPTSNFFTCAVRSLPEHPLPLFLERGLCATLNTDDPSLFSGISLQHEYRVAHAEMGLTGPELTQIRKNGWQAAFLRKPEREVILKKHTPKTK